MAEKWKGKPLFMKFFLFFLSMIYWLPLLTFYTEPKDDLAELKVYYAESEDDIAE